MSLSKVARSVLMRDSSYCCSAS